MSKKLKFHFTEGHTHIATGVVNMWNSSDAFVYSTFKENDGIVTSSDVTVPMHDVLYIEVLDDAGGITVVPGLITSFSAVPNAAQVDKVQKDLQNKKEADEKFLKEKEIKRQKTAQRKKEQHAKHLGITVEQLESLHKK